MMGDVSEVHAAAAEGREAERGDDGVIETGPGAEPAAVAAASAEKPLPPSSPLSPNEPSGHQSPADSITPTSAKSATPATQSHQPPIPPNMPSNPLTSPTTGFPQVEESIIPTVTEATAAPTPNPPTETDTLIPVQVITVGPDGAPVASIALVSSALLRGGAINLSQLALPTLPTAVPANTSPSSPAVPSTPSAPVIAPTGSVPTTAAAVSAPTESSARITSPTQSAAAVASPAPINNNVTKSTSSSNNDPLDKRRRNTAASARFRAKKKLHEQAMERMAKEMTGKVDALQSKISGMDAEIIWLRRMYADSENLEALVQAYQSQNLSIPLDDPSRLLQKPVYRHSATTTSNTITPFPSTEIHNNNSSSNVGMDTNFSAWGGSSAGSVADELETAHALGQLQYTEPSSSQHHQSMHNRNHNYHQHLEQNPHQQQMQNGSPPSQLVGSSESGQHQGVYHDPETERGMLRSSQPLYQPLSSKPPTSDIPTLSSASSHSTPISSYPPAPSPSTTQISWDSLRKQAKQLENELEGRLMHFSKLGSSAAGSSSASSSSSGGGALSGGGGEGEGWGSTETAEREVEELIRKLTTIVNTMASYLDNLPPTAPSNPSMMHVLQRHRDVLFDYSKEFKRTKANIQSAREHSELLSSVREDINSYKHSNMQDYMLQERGKIDNSHSMADMVLEQAYETRENLDSQRKQLFGARTRLGSTLQRFPLVNNLISKINTKKKKDALVLAGVI
ncbi:Golgi SNAP receptor complex member 1, partial [Chytridiales sp. JEL 0842]